MGRLDGKAMIITGAASGIGLAGAHLFAREGAAVAIFDIDDVGGRDCEASIKAQGGQAVFIHTDVTDPTSVQNSVRSAVDRFGRLDILYNNAGGGSLKDGSVTEVDLSQWWATINLDLFGTLLCSRIALPHIIAAGGGSVLNTTSCVALRGVAGRDAYTAAKGAVISLTRSMAVEYAKYLVRVNAIAPGVTRSARVLGYLERDARTQALVDKHLLGLVEPEDVAAAALFLTSVDAQRITGIVLSVDSGVEAVLTDRE